MSIAKVETTSGKEGKNVLGKIPNLLSGLECLSV